MPLVWAWVASSGVVVQTTGQGLGVQLELCGGVAAMPPIACVCVCYVCVCVRVCVLCVWHCGQATYSVGVGVGVCYVCVYYVCGVMALRPCHLQLGCRCRCVLCACVCVCVQACVCAMCMCVCVCECVCVCVCVCECVALQPWHLASGPCHIVF